MSIKLKINLLLLTIGIITSALIAGFNYYYARQSVFKEAQKKAEIISSYAMASFKYTKKTMSPLAQKLLGDKVYHPELEAGFYVAKAIADIFSKSQPGYVFKQACPNPMNPQNIADAQETAIVEYFAANRQLKIKTGILEKDGVNYYYVANPVVADKENCMRCHGERSKAPPAVVAKYPGPEGYDYTFKDVVATFVIYVPIDKAMEGITSAALRTILMGVGGILIVILAAWIFISRSVTTPITTLTRMADEISLGKGINRKIETYRSDEIGTLYKSFDRMRVSIKKLVIAWRAAKKTK